MKSLKLICLIAFISLLGSNLFARDLKIKVTASGAPLGYSYIYVNDDVKAVADSTGVAFIPLSLLDIDDVISASFVGFNGAKTIFDSNAESKKEITLNLTSDFTLDEIVVTTDISKIYKKYIKRWKIPSDWRKGFTLEFDMCRSNDSINLECNGSVSLMYDFRREKMSDPIKDYYSCLEFKAEGDTTNLVNNLASSHNLHFNNFKILDYFLRNAVKKSRDNQMNYGYGYIGVVDNYRAFTFSMSNEDAKGQYILYFDKESGIIRRVISNTLVYDENRTIIREYKGVFELGLIDNVLTITSFNDSAENYENGATYAADVSITAITKVSKGHYRNFEDNFIEIKRFIVD